MKMNLNDEEKEMLKPIAQLAARDFLQVQLEAVEKKIDKRRAFQERFYEGETLSKEETMLLAVYDQEKALIQELMQASEEKLFLDVMRQRTAQTQRREFASSGKSKSSAANRTERWRLKNEGVILAELQRRWLHWLKER